MVVTVLLMIAQKQDLSYKMEPAYKTRVANLILATLKLRQVFRCASFYSGASE